MEQVSFNFMPTVTIYSDFGAPKIKSLTVSIVSPSIWHEVMGPDAMILVFWMLSFKPAFSLYFFTFIKRLFSSSSLSAIRVVSFEYLTLLLFFPAILIPASDSSGPAFHTICSAYKFNNNNIPRHTLGENHGSNGYVHSNVHCSTVYSSQDMEAT